MAALARLRLLGCLALDVHGAPASGAAAQQRPLAVLTVLAAAGPAGVPRDRLLALLWGDRHEERARAALNQALYALRRDLGAPDLVTGAATLRLDTDALACDLWDLEAALAAGDVDAALAVYAGPLLDGVLLARTPEFERWAEVERMRVAGRVAALVERAAAAASAAGDHRRAVALWERRSADDPLDVRVTLAWMAALDAAGERAAAFAVAGRHALLRRTELDAGPAPEVEAALAQMRRTPVAPRAGSSLSIAPPEHVATVDAFGGEAPVARHRPDASGAAPALRPMPDAGPARASATLPSREPTVGRRRTAWQLGAAAATVVAVVAFGVASLGFAERGGHSVRVANGALAAGTVSGRVFDPRHVAVLYFDDHSEGRTLGHVADGLTEELIHELSGVSALRVVSRNGVKPFRGRAVPFDSLVAALRVGSVVEGSVQRSGARLRATVQLIDAASGTHLASDTLARPMNELFALQRELASTVAAFLRRQLGEEVRLREVRAETRSARALDLVLRAERAQKEAATLSAYDVAFDRPSVLAALRHADSLLAEAEQADRSWLRPTLARGWVAERTGRLVGSGGVQLQAYGAAVAFGERAVAREPESAEALELRGVARWRLLNASAATRADSALIARAEHDLRSAVLRDSTRSAGWAALSQLRRWNGAAAEADVLAQHALAADAYLETAGDVISQLYRSAFLLADQSRAAEWCVRGRRLLPTDWRFIECELTVMRLDLDRASPARAWTVVRALEQVESLPQARAAGHEYNVYYRQMTAAAVSARAGARDSARAVMARVLSAVAGHPEMQTDVKYDAAFVHAALGEHREAARLLGEYMAARPDSERQFRRDPTFRALGVDPAAIVLPGEVRATAPR